MSTETRLAAVEGLVRNLLTRAGASSAPVTSVFSRTGAVVAASNDYSEAQISFTDITTNNASTSKHGYLPKLSNVATQFLDGTGGFSTPASASKILFGCSGAFGGTSGTAYLGLLGYGVFNATETNNSQRIPFAGTAKKLWVYVAANAAGSNSTLTFRDDAADTSIVVTIAGGATGEFSDDSNTAAVAANSVCGFKTVTGGGAALDYRGVTMEYDPS